ncbi:MAG: ectoine hydroxylase-related dioxygenase (phytanoyl-CoA dioxygenase family) [Halioglobus sp.]|jgi:ectoine hydroxylase-related dioxygenase (phytanoyl-CoA dioxygenase family)
MSGTDSPHQALLDQVEKLVGQGDYDSGIALLQSAAKETGSDDLARVLIQLRVEAATLMPPEISLEPMYEANELLGDTAAMQARLASDGYLFLRNIIPVDALENLRDEITQILAGQGWIEDGEERMKAKAVCRPRREGQPKFFKAHDEIVKLEAFHSMAHEEALMNVMQQALGDTVFPHPLSIVRLVFPDVPELATPPHQDFPNNQGTPNLTAAWMPLGDCGIDDGSLAIMEGSNQFGVLPLDFHLGAGNRQAVLNDEVKTCRWVGADFKAGDVVLFTSLTIHRALTNKNLERMRLSVDFRYQLEGEALTPVCLRPHFERVSWEDIYSGWKSEALKYYWRAKNYVEVPWNPELHELSDDTIYDAYIQELEYNLSLNQRQEARAAETQD